jgi:hypothetical protein
VKWSGHHRPKRLPWSLPGKTRQKSTARGNGLDHRDERRDASQERHLPMPREWDPSLSSRGESVVERSPSRERVYPAGCLPRPTCPIVSTVLCASGVSNQEPKAIVPVAKVAVRRLLPPPAAVERTPVVLGPMRWVDVAGRALRRTWTAHWRRQYVEILPLIQTQQKVGRPPRPPRAIRSRHRWRWQDRLACNAWWGPPHLRVSVAGVPAFLAMQ